MLHLGGTITLLELVQVAQAIIVTLRLPIQILIPPEFGDYFGLTPQDGAEIAEAADP